MAAWSLLSHFESMCECNIDINLNIRFNMEAHLSWNHPQKNNKKKNHNPQNRISIEVKVVACRRSYIWESDPQFVRPLNASVANRTAWVWWTVSCVRADGVCIKVWWFACRVLPHVLVLVYGERHIQFSICVLKMHRTTTSMFVMRKCVSRLLKHVYLLVFFSLLFLINSKRKSYFFFLYLSIESDKFFYPSE